MLVIWNSILNFENSEKNPSPENILSSKSLSFIKKDCNLFLASSTSRADCYLLFLCHWRTLFYMKRFQSWPKKQKLNKIAWAFLRLHKWKKFLNLERPQSSNSSNNLCNATDRQKAFSCTFVLHLINCYECYSNYYIVYKTLKLVL